MAVDEKWYFTKEQLLQSPSRKSGYDVDKELSCRQQAANFIQDMGQRLQVSQLCINTAIVYMHRFYVFHSLAAFHRNAIAAAALFLAAKVEEQPRKLEHVIKVAHLCLHRENPNLDTKSELYLEQAQDLVFNENVLLQTLGFDVAIDHPHTHVVRCCQLVRASKDLAQTSYFMASNSLHLTTMCLQYKPTVVACFCIHLACKWSNWEIPRSNEGKDWFWYIDKTVTVDLLEQLTAEFLAILDKCPTKLKRKMMSMNQNNTPGFTQQSVPNDSLHFDEPRKLTGSEANKPPEGLFPIQKSNSQLSNETKPGTSASASSTAQPGHAHHQKIDYREYREKKERERIEREKQQQQQHQRDGHNMSSSNHHHHSKIGVMPGKNHSNVQSRSSNSSTSHKSYQQLPHGMQQNLHFQNLKENRDSQNFQSSSSTKDSSYLKQHPPHGERDGSKENASFHGQYSQNSSNVQQKPNYSGSYPHRERSKGSHGVQSSGNSNLPQTHHNQNQNLVSNSMNLINNPREALGNQRESAIAKDSTDSQSQSKDVMSSSIRDIISQTVSQKDVHSMTNERKEHIRDKSRMNYIHGNSSTSNFRPESVKSGREQVGLNFHESVERNLDDFSKLKDKCMKKDEESVIETVKSEPVKLEKFDETDVADETGGWSFGVTLPNARNDKNNLPVHTKNEPNAGKSEFSVDSNSDTLNLNKPQTMHTAKMMDSKYKSHHYHSNSKNSDISQIKAEKPGAQSNSDFNKKPSDKIHEKHRKPQELERVPNTTLLEVIGSLNNVSKNHKIKEGSTDTHRMLQPGQYSEQRVKEKLSPSKYQEVKPLQRPSNVGYVKLELSHFVADGKSTTNAAEGDKIEGTNQSSSVKSNVVNTKFSNEIRSDLGAIIYPTNPKSTQVSKPNQGFSLSESKLSLANSVSTVNLLGIEKMVDTSISPAKQTSQFGSNTAKPNAPNPLHNSTALPVNTFAPSALASAVDQSDKMLSEQKSNILVTNQDPGDVDLLGYAGKKRSEKKKKKEKHKHKEKDKDKSERKKEKKKHKDKEKERPKEKDKHKDKEKHKDKHKEREIDVVTSETPIKITIPKDKISGSLKIKISKDCLKKEDVEPSKTNTSGELKIKISKDVFSNIGNYKEEPKIDSRKRERSPKTLGDLPHSKVMKTSEKKSSASSLKPNGMEGSSRNSNSRRYSVSENDSCFDISSFYDCPFDFEENGQGIIKTPDYDFEALNVSELPHKSNTSPDIKEIEDCDKNSHNESGLSKNNNRVATGYLEAKMTPKDVEFSHGDDSCGDITINPIPKAISSLKIITVTDRGNEPALKNKTIPKLNESQFDIKRDGNLDDAEKNQMISFKNCDVLKNYKTILDSHARRCESEMLKHSVSPVSSEENTTETNNNDDNNNKNAVEVLTNYNKNGSKGSKNSSETENPNYYNKYFKKDSSGPRVRSRDDKWPTKDKSRFDDRRYSESRRYRTDYNERDRRDDRRYYRDYREYSKDASHYYYERKDERLFEYPDYSAGQYFSTSKAEGSVLSLNYDVNANGTPTVYQNCIQTKTSSQFPQICESALPGSSSDMNVQYQYGYFNNYMYPPNGGYRFYGNAPFVNVSLIQQQPIPPGTGDLSVVQLEPPPLPLEPPPDLPPPPETPPPSK